MHKIGIEMEEFMEFDTSFLSHHLNCTKEEKLSCLKTTEHLYRLYQIGRQKGLLALETEIHSSNEYNDFLVLGIELITDGTDPVIVEKILSQYLLTSEWTAKQFFEHYLILLGVLNIQKSTNPSIFKEELCSCFGFSLRNTVYKQYKDNEYLPYLPSLLEEFASTFGSYPKPNCLEEITAQLSDPAIWRIIKETPLELLEPALLGSSSAVYERYLRNLSHRMLTTFFEDISNQHNYTLEIIQQAQNQILTIISNLEEQGEIVHSPVSIRPIQAETQLTETNQLYKGSMLSQKEINSLLNKST